MFSEEKLNALLSTLSLNDQALSAREALCDWQTTDQQRLTESSKNLSPDLLNFSEHAEQYFAQFPDIAAQLSRINNAKIQLVSTPDQATKLWQGLHDSD